MSQSDPSNDAFKDSLNFVKKLWGGMNVPGTTMPGMPAMPMPPMSLEELDKRIQELKSVETWLNMNANMVRNSIQALEVQRATIATLQSLSSTMAQTMQGKNAHKADKNSAQHDQNKTDAASEFAPLISQSAAWWNTLQDQFKQALGTALEKSKLNATAAKAGDASGAKASITEPGVKTPRRAATKNATKRKSTSPAKARKMS